jgi:AraC family transcriptional regulator
MPSRVAPVSYAAELAALAPSDDLGGESPLADILVPPTRSSLARSGWERVLVEQYESEGESWEGEKELPYHVLGFLVRPPRLLACRADDEPMRSSRPAAGHLVIVPAGRSHWCAWEGPLEFLVTYVSPGILARTVHDDGLDAGRCDLAYRFGQYDTGMASILFALRRALIDDGREDRLYVDTLAAELAVKLLRGYGTAPLRLKEYRQGLSREKMRVVLDYMNASLDRNVTLGELASLVDMSQYHFLRLFRASSGRTPHRYLVERRVEVAKSLLLRDDVSLAEVAYRVGFADQSHFTRHFRRIVGAPPGQLRRTRRPTNG